MPVTCIVVNCGSRGDRDNVSFYRIPNILSLPNKPHKNELSKTRRALWIASIKRDDLTESKLKYQRVCSKHFITGEPALLENKDHPDWVYFVCQPTSILLTFLSRGLDCLIKIKGGISSIPKDDPQVKIYLKDGLNRLDQSSPHAHKYKVLEILEASSQVVSGSLHRIKARITVSDCEKGKNVDPDTCGVLKDAPVKVCNFKVWDQPWLSQGRQTNITCDNEQISFRQRRSVNLPSHEDVVGVFFKQFQLKHSKIYLTKAEYKRRLAIFKNNLNMIDLLNKYEQGTARYGITQYADLTQTEFSALHGLRTDLQNENEVPFPQAKIPEIDLPTSLDWREKNAVTEVKDQGLCGSCWAFSTTGNIEGQYAIKYKSLKSFSEQELVDCDKLDDGCSGGLMDNAYRAIENLGGLELENQYPYEGKNDKCNFNKSKIVVHVASALNISSNETDMAKWLTQNGPISIAINANAMQFYIGGVSHPLKIFCNPNNLDHGVLVVGYGVHTSSILKKVLPYWIVKNSWGKSWGEQGYYRVYRGDGTCGLNKTPSSAIVS